MFSFFKRKKSVPDQQPSDEALQPSEPAGVSAPDPAPQAVPEAHSGATEHQVPTDVADVAVAQGEAQTESLHEQAQPKLPSQPEQPSPSAPPVTPEIPETPEVPEIPEIPETQPEIPEVPGVPEIPEIPAEPAREYEPVEPSVLPDTDTPAPVPDTSEPAVEPSVDTTPALRQEAVQAPDTVAESAQFQTDAVVAPELVAEPSPETLLAAAPQTQEKPGGSWLARLRKGLSRTGQSIGGLFVGVKVDESLFEELEMALLMADAGVEATESLLAALRSKVKKDRLEDASQVREALRDILTQHLTPLEKPFPLNAAKPLIVMIAGVNGAGKTTSIGKLAHAFQSQGASVLLAAGDTFRAAAREQLIEWGARNCVTVIAQEGADPAAVAFDAVNAGRARGAHVVMVDTAGRLPTQLHLMEELKKIRRVIGKAQGDAPHEVLLVIDGNTGQNVLSQIRAFDAAIELTGLVVTKLDGTAKGGTLAAVAAGSQGVRPVPVYWIGVGEGMHDLQPFVAREFAQALIGN